MEAFNNVLGGINGVIWHSIVLYVVLGVGVLFTIWSGFCQYRALTHGVSVTRGKYDDPNDPGAINHFQALSAALSATVGLGNIAGVGVAVALGGPGAVFWMWMVGIFGMALKTTEVSLSMLYRNTEDPDNPHGGPMFVAAKAFKEKGFGAAGKLIGGIFVVTLLISTITGGNMFQAWSVGQITEDYFSIPSIVSGIILAVLVGAVIVGGIKRIGAVAGRIVPFMCAIYMLAAIVVLIMNIGAIPAMLKLIVIEAFSPSEASGAFLGGTAGYALLWGMKRALFSSEAGQGSSPIAHSAAKTDEPIREGIVAGLEPFIDTIVVCTMTALVILTTGAFNRGPETQFESGSQLAIVMVDANQNDEQDTNDGGTPLWTVVSPGVEVVPLDANDDGEQDTDDSGAKLWMRSAGPLPVRSQAAHDISGAWSGTENVFLVVHGDHNGNTGLDLHRLPGEVTLDENDVAEVVWGTFASAVKPTFADVADQPFDGSVFVEYPGPSLTGHAFDRAIPGLGKYLVTLAAWLFALSTMISWSYYGEQGVVFLFGQRLVLPYKLIYCALVIVATIGIIETDAELDNLTALGTGVMLWANIPIMLIFGATAMRAYHAYGAKLKSGEFHPHKAPSFDDVVSGRDVEDE